MNRDRIPLEPHSLQRTARGAGVLAGNDFQIRVLAISGNGLHVLRQTENCLVVSNVLNAIVPHGATLLVMGFRLPGLGRVLPESIPRDLERRRRMAEKGRDWTKLAGKRQVEKACRFSEIERERDRGAGERKHVDQGATREPRAHVLLRRLVCRNILMSGRLLQRSL